MKRYETATGVFWLPLDAPDDVIISNILEDYIFEVQVVREVQKYIKHGTTVIDVGACYGQMSMMFASMSDVDVIAIEASPFVYQLCKMNFEENGVKAKLINAAAWNRSGERVRLMKYEFSHFKSYGCFGVEPKAKEGVEVETLAIDDLVFEKPVSAIKIDAQGCDLLVMRGAEKTLKTHRCHVIYESEGQYDDKFGITQNDYDSFIRSVGYKKIGKVGEFNYVIAPE